MQLNKQHNMSIGVLAERYRVCPETLRVWERQGLIPPATRTPGGHRRYAAEHVEALDRLLFAAPSVAAAKQDEPAMPCGV